MNAMTHMAHPVLLQFAFANWPSHIAMPQDEIRDLMIATVPDGYRPGAWHDPDEDYDKPKAYLGNQAQAERRAEVTPEVLRLHAEGLSQTAICNHLGAGHKLVRGILKEISA